MASPGLASESLRASLNAPLGAASTRGNPRAAIDFYRCVVQQTWTHTSAIVGTMGARAVVEHSARSVSRQFPDASRIVVTEEGVDLSELLASENGADPDHVRECLEELCMATFQVLADLTGDVILGPLLVSLKTQPCGGEHGPV